MSDSMKCEDLCIICGYWPESIYHGKSHKHPRRQNDLPLASLCYWLPSAGVIGLRTECTWWQNGELRVSPRAETPHNDVTLATAAFDIWLVSSRDQHWTCNIALFLEEIKLVASWPYGIPPSQPGRPASHPPRARHVFQVCTSLSPASTTIRPYGVSSGLKAHTGHLTRRPTSPWRQWESETVTTETTDHLTYCAMQR